MKALYEKRNTLVEEMETIVSKAKTETRAMSEEENTRFDAIKTEIASIDKTINAEKESRAMEKMTEIKDNKTKTSEELEIRAFDNFLRGVAANTTEERANMVTSDNGAVIPTTIANRIIKKAVDISPIYQLATKYNVKGKLSIPYYDEDTDKITVQYATEFTEGEAHSGKFASIEMNGFLAKALCLVSKSLINNSDFDVVSFVINDMAQEIANWLEKELLNGTADKIDGLKGIKLNIVSQATTAITADELIDVQEQVLDRFQANAIWIMSKATRTAIRKLKDSDNNYILNKDATSKWGYTLFGKDVYVSANMPNMEAGKVAIYYGDMSGLAVKLSEDINIAILREKYAEQHAIGVLGFVEVDAKVENAQKIAKLTMHA